MIVVTGSTGHVGRLVAAELVRRGFPVRLVVRDPTRAPLLPGAEVVVADYADCAALAEALREGDHVFMVSIAEGHERRMQIHGSFVETAVRKGVGQIVYLSFVNAGRPGAIFSHCGSHGATEDLLRESGVPFTSIRNAMYADLLPTRFDDQGVNRIDGGNGRMSFSYRPELAQVIAVTLTEPGHEGKIYDITGPESVSMPELAQIAAEVTGDPYRYEPAPDAWWEARWQAEGRADWRMASGLTSYAALRAGELDVVTDDYRAVTGRDPLTVAQVIERHRAEMPLSDAPAGGVTT